MIVAGRGERAVVLADVDAVGAEFRGEGGVIVEDERHAGGAAEREQFFRDAPDGGEVVALARSWRRSAPPANRGR